MARVAEDALAETEAVFVKFSMGWVDVIRRQRKFCPVLFASQRLGFFSGIEILQQSAVSCKKIRA
jgi:hypothetical protein